MNSPKAIVFDADGTLLNSRELILAAYAHVAETHGLPKASTEEILRHMGKSLHEIYLALYPDADPRVLIKTNNKYVMTHAVDAAAFDGLEELLQSLTKDGWKLAVCTGGNHKINELLAHHGIDYYFTSVVHSERITKQKPEPEGLLLALQECGVEPSRAVMVGDMRYDILAGKNGGVSTTVGVTHGFGTQEELKTAGADYIIDSLPELLSLVEKIEQ